MNVPVRIGIEDQPSSAGWELLSFEHNNVRVVRAGGAPTPTLTVGAQVYVQWLDVLKRIRLEVSGRVISSEAEGFTVSLFRAEPELTESLQRQFTGDLARPAEAARELDLVALRSALCESIAQHFHAQFPRFFEAAEAWLARSEPSDASIRADKARARLAASHKLIEQEVCSELQRPFLDEAQLRQLESGRRGLLKLVDGEELELWLIRSESAAKLEREFRHQLDELQPRLDRLAQWLPQVDAHALSPERIGNALIRSFKVVELDYQLQQSLLRLAGQPQPLLLGLFYQRILERLSRGGIGAPPAPARIQLPPGASAAGQQLQLRGASQAPALLSATVSPQMVYAATRSLWSYAYRRDAARTQAGPGAPASSVAMDQDLLRAASQLASDEASLRSARNFKSSLSDRVAALSGQNRVQLDERQSEAVELLGRLNEALHHDPLLVPSFRRWSRRLLPALLGTQLSRSDLGNQGELIKQLFALIEFGSVLCEQQAGDHRTSSIREGIDAVVGELAQHSQLDEAMVREACRKLEALLERQRRAGAAVEDRVVETCQGQHRLEQARRHVAKELVVAFGGRELPEVLSQVLDQGFRAELVLAFLRGGTEGAQWCQDLELLTQLEQKLRDASNGSPLSDSQALVEHVRTRLVHGDPMRLPQIVAQLESALAGARQSMVPYASENIASPVPGLTSFEDAGHKTLNEQVEMLQPGDWLSFDNEQAEPRLAKLAWHSADRLRFVFVSQLGRKAADLSRAELVDLLRGGRARVLDESGASIIERAWRHMLEGLHNELAEQATHDPLTGLLNRKELDRHLLAWINRPQQAQLGLLWIGVDRLRLINQSHGMEAGDCCLNAVASALQRVLEKAPGVAARIAGDEFVLLMEGLDERAILAAAKHLLEALSQAELSWKQQVLRISVSIGVVICGSEHVDPVAILKEAESACRAAKESGRARVYLHQKDDQRLAEMRQSVSWIGRVEQALKDDSLLLYGQRAMSLSEAAKSQPDYLEVLLRMRSGDRIHTPEQFILAAERYGQIAAIDQFVCTRLIAQLAHASRRPEFRVAFNISARNIVDPEFIERMVRELERQAFPLQLLCVELTETAAIEQLALAQRGMQRLHDSGLSMVLDDFGSGWSSYQYLKRLPVDIVKVDGAFIREIATSEQDLALARSINEIAHLMGKQTVAEHVEDQATLSLVREIGFDYAQGYFVARPEPLSQLL